MIIELILPGFRSLSQIAEDTSFYYSETLMYILLLILITISLAAILIRYVSNSLCLIVLNINQIFIFPVGFIKEVFPFNYLLVLVWCFVLW